MTEQEWLACADPTPMLEFLRGKASDRKLRLFACVCCRRIVHLLGNWGCRVTAMVEDYVENPQRGGLHAARRVAMESARHCDTERRNARGRVAYCRAEMKSWASSAVWEAARQNPATAAESHLAAARSFGWWEKGEEEVNGIIKEELLKADASAAELQVQVTLLRDIVGNPFRPLPPRRGKRAWERQKLLWLAWNDGTVVKLAESIYDERAFDRLPVLADALEGAGCTNADILAHCRGPGPHVRGCWALDLILGKE